MINKCPRKIEIEKVAEKILMNAIRSILFDSIAPKTMLQLHLRQMI